MQRKILVHFLCSLFLLNLSSLSILGHETYNDTCKCYCSDKCGPRDVKPDDTPFFDTEFGLCFCKMRDKNNFMPKQCHLQPKPTYVDCCNKGH